MRVCLCGWVSHVVSYFKPNESKDIVHNFKYLFHKETGREYDSGKRDNLMFLNGLNCSGSLVLINFVVAWCAQPKNLNCHSNSFIHSHSVINWMPFQFVAFLYIFKLFFYFIPKFLFSWHLYVCVCHTPHLYCGRLFNNIIW